MKKLLFALLCVTNLFAQDQNIPSQAKPDLIKQAIERNLDSELIKKAIEAKKPTAEEIKSYFELSTKIYGQWALQQQLMRGYGWGILITNLLYMPFVLLRDKLLGLALSTASVIGGAFWILIMNRAANNSKKIYEFVHQEFLKKYKLCEI